MGIYYYSNIIKCLKKILKMSFMNKIIFFSFNLICHFKFQHFFKSNYLINIDYKNFHFKHNLPKSFSKTIVTHIEVFFGRSFESISSKTYEYITIVLETSTSSDLHKIIGMSIMWPTIAISVLQHLKQKVEKDLIKINSKLWEIRKLIMVLIVETNYYHHIINNFYYAIPSEYDALHAKYRFYVRFKFFQHLSYVIVSTKWNDDIIKSDTFQIIYSKISIIIAAYDHVIKDKELIKDAISHLQFLLNHFLSIRNAEIMIDDIIKTNQLDSALLLVISKSYMSVKNSSFSETNVADIMIHLYFRVQEQLSKFKSSEVRILKYLLTLNDSLKVHAEMIRALYLGIFKKFFSKTIVFKKTQ